MQKLYGYVDETGQDTKGRLFVVALVILSGDRQPLRERLQQIVSQTIDAIARGIRQQARGTTAYRASVFIDALGREQRKVVGAALRSQGIRVEKVRGLRDEADEFIWVADALAGFVRDALEDREPWKGLYKQALRRGVLKRL